jgi:membrane glycosyltransferase
MSGLNTQQLSKSSDDVPFHADRALPKESPLDMPRHQVSEHGLSAKKGRPTLAYMICTLFARLFVLAVTVALSVYGVAEMYGVLSTNNITYLQWLFLVLFSINFIWIAFAFAQALIGFLACIKPWPSRQMEVEAPFKTAILLPIYNEDPVRIKVGLETMRADLLAKAPGKYVFFILSDTNRADAWIAEEYAFLDVIFKEERGCPVYYRRRSHNTERKAGNIADWVQRWGGAYEAMIVLDADSTMSAACMQTLSRRLAAAPGVGLIQTLPTIVHANTLYGRLQQYANQCFGPIYAEGLSAWHGLSSNFWGHNAIIRTKAFAESCCLPILPGKPPFGGHVLSHDFIEAGLLRRAGWGVRFDTDIKASFEEAPPSLIDVMIRDRRWCQGNLQHTSFLFAQGFVFPTRLHLFSGLMSYLSAVFWLSLIVVGLAIAIQASVVRPEYFADPSLFPVWPVFDAERALRLFVVSMGIVLAPKAFGWLMALLKISRCRHFGGPILLSLSTVFEMLISALYAPILMVSQFGLVVSVFRGKDSGWMPQSRNEGAMSWKSAARAHFSHTVFGVIVATIALLISKELFYWLLTITAGLMLSIPLSWLSGGVRSAKLFKKIGLLRVPEEKYPDHILVELQHKLAAIPSQETTPALTMLANNPALCAWHIAQLPRAAGLAPVFHAPAVTAEWKVCHAESLAHLEAWLEPAEMMALLSSPDCIEQIKKIGKLGLNLRRGEAIDAK